MTPRRLWVLIRRLPPEASLWRERDAAKAEELEALTGVERQRERIAHYRAMGANSD